MWLPGSETQLAIVTDTFVKIYDLSVDSLSPSYYFIVCSEKIRDACFVVTEEVSKSLHIFVNFGKFLSAQFLLYNIYKKSFFMHACYSQ